MTEYTKGTIVNEMGFPIGQVVKCKDCFYAERSPEGTYCCMHGTHNDNWYCADGKMREEWKIAGYDVTAGQTPLIIWKCSGCGTTVHKAGRKPPQKRCSVCAERRAGKDG